MLGFVLGGLALDAATGGDLLEDAGDWLNDEVWEPIADFNTGMMMDWNENPGNMLWDAAIFLASLIPGVNAIVVPLLVAGKAKDNGADWDEALEEGVKAYATQEVVAEFIDSQVGQTVSGNIAERLSNAGVDPDTAQRYADNITRVTSAGFAGGIVNVIDGDSFSDGFEQAAYFEAAVMGTDVIMNYLDEQTEGFSFKEEVTRKDTNGVDRVVAEDGSFLYDTNGNIATDVNGIAKKAKEEFRTLPDVVQNVVSTAIGAKLSGQEVTDMLLATAATESLITMETVGNLLGDGLEGTGLDINTDRGKLFLAYLTPAIQESVASIATMGLGVESGMYTSQAIRGALDEYGSSVLFIETKDFLQNTSFVQDVLTQIDGLTGKQEVVTTAAEQLGVDAVLYNDAREKAITAYDESQELRGDAIEAREVVMSTASGQMAVTIIDEFNNSYEAVTDPETGDISYKIKEGEAGFPANTFASYKEYYESVTAGQTYTDANGEERSYEQWTTLERGINTMLDSAKTYNSYYQENKNLFEDPEGILDTLKQNYETSQAAYDNARESLFAEAGPIGDYVDSAVLDSLEKDYVQALVPSFDEEYYRNLYGNQITEGMSAHKHYILNGAKQGLITSQSQADALENAALTALKGVSTDIIYGGNSNAYAKLTETEPQNKTVLDNLINEAAEIYLYNDDGSINFSSVFTTTYFDADGNETDSFVEGGTFERNYNQSFLNTANYVRAKYEEHIEDNTEFTFEGHVNAIDKLTNNMSTSPVFNVLLPDNATPDQVNDYFADVLIYGGVGFNEANGRREFVTAPTEAEREYFFDPVTGTRTALLSNAVPFSELIQTDPEIVLESYGLMNYWFDSWCEALFIPLDQDRQQLKSQWQLQTFNKNLDTTTRILATTGDFIFNTLLNQREQWLMNRVPEGADRPLVWKVPENAEGELVSGIRTGDGQDQVGYQYFYSRDDVPRQWLGYATVDFRRDEFGVPIVSQGENGDATIEASFADFVTRSKDAAIGSIRTFQDFMFDFENTLGATGEAFLNFGKTIYSAGTGFVLGMEASNVTNSAVYKWLENTENLREAARLAKMDERYGDYSENLQNLQVILDQRAVDNPDTPNINEAVWDTTKIFGDGFDAYPREFMIDIVAKESLEELAPYLIGGLVKKGGEAFTEISKKAATAFGFGTAAGLDVLESMGGEYIGGYEEALDVIKTNLNQSRLAGNLLYTEQQIDIISDHYAQDIARKQGYTAGAVTAAMFVAGGGALDRTLLRNTGIPDDVFTDLGRKLNADFFAKNGKNAFADGALIVAKETMSEFIEEYVLASNFEQLIYQWDPNRNVTGNVLFNAYYGALIASTATTAGVLFAPNETLTDINGNEYAETVDMPSAAQVTGATQFKSTGDTLADILMLSSPEVSFSIYSGSQFGLENTISNLNLPPSTATALRDASNDPYYNSNISTLPGAETFFDPDLNTFPTANTGELHYDARSQSTYRYDGSDWQRTARGNQTIKGFDAVDQGRTLPTPEQVERSLYLQDEAWKRHANWDDTGLEFGQNERAGYNAWIRENYASLGIDTFDNRHYTSVNFVVGPNPVEGWEDMTYEERLELYTGFNTIYHPTDRKYYEIRKDGKFLPSHDEDGNLISYDRSTFDAAKGDYYFEMEMGNPTIIGQDNTIPQNTSSADIGISETYEGYNSLTDVSIITDPNTGLSYYITRKQTNTQRETGDESNLNMQMGAWVPDAPSALSIYNQLTIPESPYMDVVSQAVNASEVRLNNERLWKIPPTTFSRGTSITSTGATNRSLKPTIIQNYGGTLDITETGQTLYGMEQMIGYAAGNLLDATTQQEYDVALENYKIVHDAYAPYIERERILRGLEGSDSYSSNFAGGTRPLTYNTVNGIVNIPTDMIDFAPQSDMIQSGNNIATGSSTALRTTYTGFFESMPNSEEIQQLLYPDGFIADGKGNFVRNVTAFPEDESPQVPNKWWDQNVHRYSTAKNGVQGSTPVLQDGFLSPDGVEARQVLWSDVNNGLWFQDPNNKVAKIQNKSYNPLTGNVGDGAIGQNLGDNPLYGYRGIWIHPFEKDQAGNGLQYVFKEGQWRAAWYWLPKEGDNQEIIEKGYKVNTGTSMYYNNGFQIPIWRQNGNEGSVIGSVDSENPQEQSSVLWGHVDSIDDLTDINGRSGDRAAAGEYVSPGLGSSTEEFLTNIGLTGDYSELPESVRNTISNLDNLGIAGGGTSQFVDPVIAKQKYEKNSLDYFAAKAVENGWSVPDTQFYIFKNGQDILNTMSGMTDEQAFNDYFINNENENQIFSGIDPSPTLTLSTYKKALLDDYNITEDEFYALHRGASLGTTKEAIDETLNNFVFNQVEDPNNLDAFGNPIIGIRENGTFVQGRLAGNVNTREDVIAKYKQVYGQTYEPTEEEINQFVGATFTVGTNGDLLANTTRNIEDVNPVRDGAYLKRKLMSEYGITDDEFYSVVKRSGSRISEIYDSFTKEQVDSVLTEDFLTSGAGADLEERIRQDYLFGREEIIQAYKNELGEDYEPSEAEINNYLGIKGNLRTTTYRKRVDGEFVFGDIFTYGQTFGSVNDIDFRIGEDITTVAEKETIVDAAIDGLTAKRAEFFGVSDSATKAALRERLLGMGAIPDVTYAQGNFNVLVRDTLEDEYNLNLRRRNAKENLKSNLFASQRTVADEYKKFTNFYTIEQNPVLDAEGNPLLDSSDNPITASEIVFNDDLIEAVFGTGLDTIYNANPSNYNPSSADVTNLLDAYETQQKDKLSAILSDPAYGTVVDELYRINGTEADAQTIVDIATEFENKWGYKPSASDLFVLAADSVTNGTVSREGTKVEYDRGVPTGNLLPDTKYTNNFGSYADNYLNRYQGTQDDTFSDIGVGKYIPASNASSNVRDAFRDLYGYTPTEDEIKQFINSTAVYYVDAETRESIEAYINPRQLSAEEANAIITNYYPEGSAEYNELMATYVGQSADTAFQVSQAAALQEDINARLLIQDQEAQQQIQADEYARIAAEFAKYGVDIYGSEWANDLANTYYNQSFEGVPEAILANDPTGEFERSLKRTGVRNTLEMLGINPNTVSEQDLNEMIDAVTGTSLADFEGDNADTYAPVVQPYVDRVTYTTDKARGDVAAALGIDVEDLGTEYDTYVASILDEQLGSAASKDKIEADITSYDEAKTALVDAGIVNPTDADIRSYMGFAPEGGITFTPEEVADLRYRGILGQFGTPAVQDAEGNVVTPATGIYAEIDTLRGQGIDPNTITDTITNYINTLGLTDSTALSDVQTEIQQYISDQGFFTGDESTITNIVSDIFGKPAELVTQDDIDAVENIIQSNINITDPTYSQEDLGLYDITGDGIINIDDRNLLNQLFAGEDAQYNVYAEGIDPTSRFADTGIFDTLAFQREQDRLAEIQRQNELDTQADINAQIQANINAQRKATQEAEERSLLYALAASQPPQQTEVEEPEVAEMGPRYDFSTIFRTPEAAARAEAVSPYGGFRKTSAKGGLITDQTDELLALLEEIG